MMTGQVFYTEVGLRMEFLLSFFFCNKGLAKISAQRDRYRAEIG